MKYWRFFLVAASGLYAAGCVWQMQTSPVRDIPQEISYLEAVARESSEPEKRAEAKLELARLYRNYRNPQINYEKSREALETYLLLAPIQGKTDEVFDWLTVFRELERLQSANEKIRRNVNGLKREKETMERPSAVQMEEEANLEIDIQRLQDRVVTLEKAYRSLQAANKDLKDANQALQETNLGLAEENKGLQADNQQMKGTLERLKILDQQMEEQREKMK
jgi:DNA repair exonuclease SbcCD ATPase subunit